MIIPPLESEGQARALPAVRAASAAGDGQAGWNRVLLAGALAGAGVELGAYDIRVVDWLALWEPHVVACIAGWVQRAGGSEEGDGDA